MTLTGFAECSKQLVAAALEDARHLGLPSDGTVVLVQNRLVDSYSKPRQESIRTALKDSGRVFHVLEFDGGRSEANAMLVDYLKAHPKACVILTEEDYGLGAAVDLHRARSEPGPPPFVLAGYASYDLARSRKWPSGSRGSFSEAWTTTRSRFPGSPGQPLMASPYRNGRVSTWSSSAWRRRGIRSKGREISGVTPLP